MAKGKRSKRKKDDWKKIAAKGDVENVIRDVGLSSDSDPDDRWVAAARDSSFCFVLRQTVLSALYKVAYQEGNLDKCHCALLKLYRLGLIDSADPEEVPQLTDLGDLAWEMVEAFKTVEIPEFEELSKEERLNLEASLGSFSIRLSLSKLQLLEHRVWERSIPLGRKERCTLAKLVKQGILQPTPQKTLVLTHRGECLCQLLIAAGFIAEL